ncbi:hypothetical protein DFP72DRAFT_760938, partial [Ephemerocybe angulata]
DIMRNNILVNVSGLPGHFMAIDLNIEHLISYLKALFAAKGIYSNWERLGNIAASVNYLMLIKKQVARSLNAGYQGKTHTKVDTTALVWRVATKARELDLLTLDTSRVENKNAKATIDVQHVGYHKFQSSSLAAFNKKMDEFKLGIPNALSPEEDDVQ